MCSFTRWQCFLICIKQPQTNVLATLLITSCYLKHLKWPKLNCMRTLFLSALLYLQSNLTPFALALYLCHSHSISSTDYKQDGKFLDPFTLQFVFDALLLFGNFMIFSVCFFPFSLSLSSLRSVGVFSFD